MILSSLFCRPVEDSPSVSDRISHRCPTMTLQVMYLVADLRRMDGLVYIIDLTCIDYIYRIDECDEHVLCQITVSL